MNSTSSPIPIASFSREHHPHNGSSSSSRAGSKGERSRRRSSGADAHVRRVIFADERSDASGAATTGGLTDSGDDGGGNNSDPHSNFGCAGAADDADSPQRSEFKRGTKFVFGSNEEVADGNAVPSSLPSSLSSFPIAPGADSENETVLDEQLLARVPSLPQLLSHGRGWPSKLADRLRETVLDHPDLLVPLLRKHAPNLEAATPSQLSELTDAICAMLLENASRKLLRLYPQSSKDQSSSVESEAQSQLDVPLLTVAKVFTTSVDLKPGTTFYELGCGSGQVVFAAALLHDFRKLHGIEAAAEPYGAAMKVFFQAMKDKDIYGKTQRVGFTQSDIFEADWVDADVVWANTADFSDEMLKQFEQQARMLRKGTQVVTMSKRLRSFHFKVVQERQFAVKNGFATIYTHLKASDPPTLVVDPEFAQHSIVTNSPSSRSVTSSRSFGDVGVPSLNGV